MVGTLNPGSMPAIEAVDEQYIQPGKTIITEEKQVQAITEESQELEDRNPEDELPEPPVNGQKPKRDPSGIKNFGDCFQALWEDYKLTKADALRALNVNSQTGITDLPSKVYERIAGMQ